MKLESLQRYIYSTSFRHFLERSFYLVNPGSKYLHNWHIDAICEALREVHSGNARRLIINIPPRYLKSFCVSVAFPAWILGNNPEKRIIVASYSEKLAIKHSLDCRMIMQSPWFRGIFQECIFSLEQNEKYKFSTTKNGYRFATSVGGTLTGEGGDILIVDDPHSPQQVMSSNYRQKVLDWYGNTFSSRLNDKKHGVIIVVMQRLHSGDLTGQLLEKGGWLHLSLPALFEEKTTVKIGNFIRNVEGGEFLFPERESSKEIEKIKLDMGSYFFNAQYQQKPMAEGSGMLREEWLHEFTEDRKFGGIYLSFDTAIKSGTNNDPTVCTVWGEQENKYYLLDVFRKWLEYPELKRSSIELLNRWKPNYVLIEDKASGQSLIQDLRRSYGYNIIPVKATRDKITRFAAVTPLFEGGAVFLKKNDAWLFDYKYEILNFPRGVHDDQVDSTSQFLDWISRRNSRTREVRIARL
ncbi:MAG: phage terminase large subunit [Rickettsiales bacterium]|jgi:predicted phage terminase large subunit-like protein|nr:phage terminase large subunit [Rickettsiales bacterium]